MTQCLIGYHGTTRESADIILERNQYFISDNEEEWLGTGVYFFENDVTQAVYWCTKARKYQNWTVLKSNLVSDNFIDLNDIQQMEQFQRIASGFKDKYKKLKNGKRRQLINAVVINAMYKMKPFDLIKATFIIPSAKPVDRTNLVPVQIQICVKNCDCIKSIEEVNVDGHEKIC